MFLEASNIEPGTTAVMDVSFTVTASAACLNFWYHMNGRHIGSLEVFERNNDDLNNRIFIEDTGMIQCDI